MKKPKLTNKQIADLLTKELHRREKKRQHMRTYRANLKKRAALRETA